VFNGVTNENQPIWVSAARPTSAAPINLGVEFAQATIINSVALYGRLNLDRAYNPSDYTIETSDTGANGSWVVQATLSRAAGTTWPIGSNATYYVATPIVTTFVPPLVTKWIRINITETWYQIAGTDTATSNTQLAELRIR
jgi:hypothetical protein